MHIRNYAAVIASFVPFALYAQTPTAFAERSQVISTGQQVRLYGLSTKDPAGKIRCFDVTIQLPIENNGRPATSAGVSSVACPKIDANEFVPGSYLAPGATYPCTLQSSPYAGRTQVDFACLPTGGQFSYSWWTGSIAGHPLETALRNAGLDTLQGNEEYSWGHVTQSQNASKCTLLNYLLGARQVGDRVTISIFNNDTTLDCAPQFLKTVP